MTVGARLRQSLFVQRSDSSAAFLEEVPVPMSGELDFQALFKEHFSYVWHTLRRLGVPSRDLEDVTHDVFVWVYRRRDQYDPERPVRAWLFGFSFRVASAYRRLSRNRRELLDGADEPLDPNPNAVEQLLSRETLDLAHEALASLELSRRAVFILHELDGCTIPEAAAALGIPVNTAYSRLRLAREDFSKAARRLALQRGGTRVNPLLSDGGENR
ncbi:MAG TPA: sigma-70 family RNA polymerase sigma factor [Polyangiaceae bacterium]